MKSNSLLVVFSVVFGIAVGMTVVQRFELTPGIQAEEPAKPVAGAAPAPVPGIAALQAEIDGLKQIVPDQAHAMQDVDYHFTNLWFAADHSNWPLAQFYFNETKSHLRWAVRIIPVRKDSLGQEIKLQDILQAMENSPLMQLGESIVEKDRAKFAKSYEFTMTMCYSCHKAADKPYLRPRIPEHPASTMMNFDPNATWPK